MYRKSIKLTEWISDFELIDYYPTHLNNKIEHYTEMLLDKTNNIINLRDIYTFACDYLQLCEKKAKSRKRNREYVLARKIYSFFSFEYTDCSYRVIGLSMNRSHCSVMWNIKKFYEDLYSNTELKQIFPDLIHNFKLIFKCNDTSETKKVFEKCTQGKTLEVYDKKVYLSAAHARDYEKYIIIRYVYR